MSDNNRRREQDQPKSKTQQEVVNLEMRRVLLKPGVRTTEVRPNGQEIK